MTRSMTMRSDGNRLVALPLRGALAVTVALVVPHAVSAQDPADVRTYLRGVAAHFGTAPEEASILAEGRISVEEVPVVLLLVREGGISPDALIVQRGRGGSWVELGRRFGVDPSDFVVEVPSTGASSLLSEAFARLRDSPRSGWVGLDFTDREYAGLVNVWVLSSYLDVPVSRVVDVYGREGSFVQAYRVLLAGYGAP